MFPLSISTVAITVLLVAAGSVNGSGTVTFGSSVEHITVKASGNSGRATFEDKAAGGNVSGQIKVNCVNVVGMTATVSGIVTHSNRKGLVVQEGVFQIVDNGSCRSIMRSSRFFHQPETCTGSAGSEFDLSPYNDNI